MSQSKKKNRKASTRNTTTSKQRGEQNIARTRELLLAEKETSLQRDHTMQEGTPVSLNDTHDSQGSGIEKESVRIRTNLVGEEGSPLTQFEAEVGQEALSWRAHHEKWNMRFDELEATMHQRFNAIEEGINTYLDHLSLPDSVTPRGKER